MPVTVDAGQTRQHRSAGPRRRSWRCAATARRRRSATQPADQDQPWRRRTRGRSRPVVIGLDEAGPAGGVPRVDDDEGLDEVVQAPDGQEVGAAAASAAAPAGHDDAQARGQGRAPTGLAEEGRTSTASAGSPHREDVCSTSVASPRNNPAVTHRRPGPAASSDTSRNSTIGVFSRGPSEAYTMNPEKLRKAVADGQPRPRRAEQVAPEEVDQDDAAAREHQVEQPHPDEVVQAHQPREPHPDPGSTWASGPARFSTPTYGGTPSATCWPGVGVDAEVPRQDAVRAVQGEDREAIPRPTIAAKGSSRRGPRSGAVDGADGSPPLGEVRLDASAGGLADWGS